MYWGYVWVGGGKKKKLNIWFKDNWIEEIKI